MERRAGRAKGALGLLAAATVPPAAAFVVGLVVIAVTLSACAPGSEGAGKATPITADGRLDMGSPGEAIEQVSDLTYYPACANEPLAYDGTTWYPFTPVNVADFPTSDPAPAAQSAADGEASVASAAWTAVSGVGTSAALAPAVAPPEPDQDTGVLTIYEGGLAHWASTLGDLDTWLTDTVLEYQWAC